MSEFYRGLTPEEMEEKLGDVLEEIGMGGASLEQEASALKTVVQSMFNNRLVVFEQATRRGGMEPERAAELAKDFRLAARMLQVLADAIDLPEWQGWHSSRREMAAYRARQAQEPARPDDDFPEPVRPDDDFPY